jgi:uncharacterized protein
MTASFTPALTPVSRDEASAFFFDATAQDRFLLRRCGDCNHVRAPEVPMCTECLSENFEWFDAAGTGHIESWVVLHSRPGADGVAPESRIVVTVELAEGPWIVSALLDAEIEHISHYMPVRIDFVRPEESESIPVFRPI